MRRAVCLCDNEGRQPPFREKPGRRKCTRIQIDQRHLLGHLLGVHASSVRIASGVERWSTGPRTELRRGSFVSLAIEGPHSGG